MPFERPARPFPGYGIGNDGYYIMAQGKNRIYLAPNRKSGGSFLKKPRVSRNTKCAVKSVPEIE